MTGLRTKPWSAVKPDSPGVIWRTLPGVGFSSRGPLLLTSTLPGSFDGGQSILRIVMATSPGATPRFSAKRRIFMVLCFESSENGFPISGVIALFHAPRVWIGGQKAQGRSGRLAGSAVPSGWFVIGTCCSTRQNIARSRRRVGNWALWSGTRSIQAKRGLAGQGVFRWSPPAMRKRCELRAPVRRTFRLGDLTSDLLKGCNGISQFVLLCKLK